MTNKFFRKKISFILAAVLACMSSFTSLPVLAEDPATEAVSTEAKETTPPETQAPETNPPETQAPETNPPETQAPETQAPETTAPETQAPETNQPETTPPEINQPENTTPETEPSKETESAPVKEETKETESHTGNQEDHKKDNKKDDKKDADKDGSSTSSQNTANNAYYSSLTSGALAYPAANVTENTLRLYAFLRGGMGLNHAAACGVLANVQLESNFTPTAVGDSGTSYGICQWHLGRFSSMVDYCNSNGLNYHTLDGQMAFLQAELSSNYPGVLSYLQNVVDTAQGAYDAAYYWCVHFEVPSDTYARADQRGNLAREEYFARSLEQEAEDAGFFIYDTEAADGKTEDTVKTNTRANLRKEPSVSGEYITTVPEGTRLEADGTKNGWVKTEYKGDSGYINGKLLDKVPETASGKDKKQDVTEKEEANKAANKKASDEETSPVKETPAADKNSMENSKEKETEGSKEEKTNASVPAKNPSVITTKRANLRKDASLSGGFLVTIPSGEEIPALEEKDGWIKTVYDGKEGYVNAKLTKAVEESTKEPAKEDTGAEETEDAAAGTSVSTMQRANLRRDASIDGKFLVTIPSGEKIPVLGEKDGWVKTLYDGKMGYVNANLLSGLH